METIAVVDVMRRAEIDVTLACLDADTTVVCSRQCRVVADSTLAAALQRSPLYDAICLPGGAANANSLAKSDAVGAALRAHDAAGKVVATICASGQALSEHGICVGRTITSHPSVRDAIVAKGLHKYSEERVVVDGNVITSRAPGTAIEWALVVVEQLCGRETRDKVLSPMLVHLPQ